MKIAVNKNVLERILISMDFLLVFIWANIIFFSYVFLCECVQFVERWISNILVKEWANDSQCLTKLKCYRQFIILVLVLPLESVQWHMVHNCHGQTEFICVGENDINIKHLRCKKCVSFSHYFVVVSLAPTSATWQFRSDYYLCIFYFIYVSECYMPQMKSCRRCCFFSFSTLSSKYYVCFGCLHFDVQIFFFLKVQNA